jgi:DNA-binding transcriptional ArsR family regulator
MEALAALADGTRRRIVELLAERDRTVGELAAQFPVSRPAVSRHLRVLRETGLVRARIDGQHRVYALDAGPLAELDGWLSRYRVFWDRRLDALDAEIGRGLPAPERPAAERRSAPEPRAAPEPRPTPERRAAPQPRPAPERPAAPELRPAAE